MLCYSLVTHCSELSKKDDVFELQVYMKLCHRSTHFHCRKQIVAKPTIPFHYATNYIFNFHMQYSKSNIQQCVNLVSDSIQLKYQSRMKTAWIETFQSHMGMTTTMVDHHQQDDRQIAAGCFISMQNLIKILLMGLHNVIKKPLNLIMFQLIPTHLLLLMPIVVKL